MAGHAYDLFLSHNWGWNSLNHEKVKIINNTLIKRGFKTWFDEDRLHGNIDEKMADGIEKSQGVVIFVTKQYHDKVKGDNDADNCKKEFNYATSQKAGRLLVVVMEEEMGNTRNWKGPLGLNIGKHLYTKMDGDLKDPTYLNEKLDALEKAATDKGIMKSGTSEIGIAEILPSTYLQTKGEPLKTVVRSSPQVLTYTKQLKIYKDLDVKEMQVPIEINIAISGKVDQTAIPFKEYLEKSTNFLSDYFKVDDGILMESFSFPPEGMCSDTASKIASSFMTESVLDKTMVALTHYDIEKHFDLSNVNFHKICHELNIDVNTIGNPDDRFLLFDLQNNCVFNVRCTQVDKEEEALNVLADGDVDVRLFLYLYGQQLLGSNMSIINAVAAPKIEVKCDNLLILNKHVLSAENVHEELNSLRIVCEKRSISKSESADEEASLMTTLIGLVFSFLAMREVKTSLLYENDSTKIQSIWLTSEQLKAIFNGKCWKIVRGCYGSGKSVVGRYLLQHLVTNATQPTDIFYIVLDSNSLLLQNMNHFSKSLREGNESGFDINIFCLNTIGTAKWLSEHVKEYNQSFSLSMLLKTLASIYNKHADRNFHLFVDEVDSEMIDENEAQHLHNIFENRDDNLQDSYILFMTRSMEKERVWYEGDKQHQYGSYGYHEKCGMEVINLSSSMRISKNVYYVVEAALKGITQPNVIPQPHLEANEEIETVAQRITNPVSISQPDFNAKLESDASLKRITVPKTIEQLSIKENEIHDNQTSQEKSVGNIPIKIVDPNEIEELGRVYASRYNDSLSKIVCSYRFNESHGVGHNINGQRPKMIFLNNDELTITNAELRDGLLNPNIIRCLAVALSKYCFSGHNGGEKTLIICINAEEMALFENALSLLKKPFTVYTDNKEISQSQLNEKILITDHNGCRGLEYQQVIVTLDPKEIFRRQCLIESMCRCTDHLILVVPYPYTETIISNQPSSHQPPESKVKKSVRFKSFLTKLTGFTKSRQTSADDVKTSVEDVSTMIKSLKISGYLDLISYSTQNSNSEKFLWSQKEGIWTNWIMNTNQKFNQYVSESDISQPREMLWGNVLERFKRNVEDLRMFKPQTQVPSNSASDDEQKESVVKEGRGVKILVLGAGGSGKTTFIRQMKIIHGRCFYDTEDLRWFRSPIYVVILSEMEVLLEARRKLKINWGDPECQASADMITDYYWHYDEGEDFFEYCEPLKKLWNDSGIQEGYERRNEFQLSDSTSYFMKNLERIGKKDFMPTKQDVLHLDLKTTGIVDHAFEIEGITFTIVDVGGARSERRKWLHRFDEVTSILFMVSSSAYDQVLREDGCSNRLEESLKLFEALTKNKYLANVTIILLLNKTDLLEQKVLSRHNSIKDFFPQFQGDPYNLNDVQHFMLQMFDSRRQERSKPLLYHFTTAIDTENIKFVFHAVKDTILQDNLKPLMLQ